MEELDPAKTEFEVMCYVKDRLTLNGQCTMDDAVRKFGRSEVQALIDNGMLILTAYGMIGWTHLGKAAMGPAFTRKMIADRITRETNEKKITKEGY